MAYGTEMKPARFDYACPASLDEVVALLAAYRGAAKVIAGGQSLMPLLAFRLAAPSLLVDLRKLPGLTHISMGDSGVQLGARVRWCDIEKEPRLARMHPLLRAAVGHVAHYQIRNRGTVGGSLAHADPAAELPGVAVTCEAEIAVIGPSGTRAIKAADFFLGPLSTALAPDELVVALHLPPWPAGRQWGFEEFARRRGDFALTGVAAFYDADGEGRAQSAHIGVIGSCSRPHRLTMAEAAVNGRILDDRVIGEAARAAAAAVDPPEDLHASAAYRRALVAALLERALDRMRGSG
jgi:carbon-monoxide dehydrogenase medium subunit